jgi:hypothetical protein
MGERVRLGGLQQAHYGRSAAEEVEPAVVGGSLLMRAGAGTEEVTQFIVASTEPVGRSWALEPTHRLISTLDATVILLQSIVEVAAGAVLHASTQRRPDRTRVAVAAIRGYPVRGNIGDCLGGLEERLRRRVGARIDRRLCFPFSVCVSADPGGDRHAETCHPVEHVASDFRLGPLVGQSPCVKSSADDGLVAKHCRLNQTPAIIARASLPAHAPVLRDGREMFVPLRGCRFD